MKKTTKLILISYISVYIVWGSTYLFIKIAVDTIPPLLVVGFRWFIGGFAFILFSLLNFWITKKREPLPDLKQISSSIMLGIFLILIPNMLLTTVEKRMDSYLAALIIATVPVVVAFFDHFLFGKKITIVRLLGIITGIAGVAVLLYDSNKIVSNLKFGLILLFLSNIAWSFGTSIGHKLNLPKSSFLNSGIQMFSTGLFCLVWAYIFNPAIFLNYPQYSLKSLAGMLYLILFGGFTFTAYNYLIKHEPASRVVSYALVNPVIAVSLGIIAGRERPVKFLAGGLPLILIGIFLMLYGEKFFKKFNFAYLRKKLSAQNLQ